MKRLKSVLSKVLSIKPGKISDKTSPENVKTWDSLHGLILVTELENEYKLKFTMEDVIAVRNVGDIKRTLKRYGVEIEE